MVSRLLAILLAVPLLAAGGTGLAVHLTPEVKRAELAKSLIERVPEDSRKSAEPIVELLTASPTDLRISLADGHRQRSPRDDEAVRLTTALVDRRAWLTLTLPRVLDRTARAVLSCTSPGHSPRMAWQLFSFGICS